MKKAMWTIFLACALLVAIPSSGHAGGGHSDSHFFFSGSITLGPWWPGYGWYPGYPYAYYPAPYYPAQPVVIQQQPPVYAEPGPSRSDYYWYYCQDPQGYYPYIKSCPGGWMKVVPQTTPPQW
jgi:hypothetical protein